MIKTINCRDLRAQLELDCPIIMRPQSTDMEIVREMVSRGLDRRDHKRPEKDRRDLEQ